MMQKIDLNSLSADDRKALMEELAAEQKKAEELVKTKREDYKKLVDEMVRESFDPLVTLSQTIKDAKDLVFSNFETVIALKAELYGVKDSQQSHTFTSEDGTISIKMGNRVVENFDDTLSAGIEKVRNYLSTLAKDTESAALVETIMDLLKKDAKGNLKASRVLELEKLAGRVQNEEFSDGIRIIRESYRPLKSCHFIEVRFKDDKGREQTLPLSISAFD